MKTISGSRVLDLIVFVGLLLVMLVGASRLAVYASAPASAEHSVSRLGSEALPASESLRE